VEEVTQLYSLDYGPRNKKIKFSNMSIESSLGKILYDTFY